MDVQVWDYENQCFIWHIPCPGEKRVRVDHFGDLSDLAVFEVVNNPDGSFNVIDGNRPLKDWEISYS